MMTEKKTSGVDYEHVKTDIEDLKKQQCAERPAASESVGGRGGGAGQALQRAAGGGV